MNSRRNHQSLPCFGFDQPGTQINLPTKSHEAHQAQSTYNPKEKVSFVKVNKGEFLLNILAC